MDNITWHIEPTSKCILECPLCDRTWFYSNFKKRELHELVIDDLISFFNKKSYKVHLCGNNGDPIYHSQFHLLCENLKKINCTIHITTNGSKKSEKWWQELVQILDDKDTITFSIDGLADTNQIYRVNSDFDSIIAGFNQIKGKVRSIWKYIVFKHNEHQVNTAREMAKELGFDFFNLERSDRWWKKDLMPSQQFVDPAYKHQIAIINNQKVNAKMQPKCAKKHDLYIDSAGNFFPCCWTGLYNFRHKDIFDPRLKRFQIKNNDVAGILNDPEVQKFFSSTKDYESASKCCKIYCGVANG